MISPFHQFITIYDEMIEKSASDYPMKSLFSWKSDKESHAGDVVSDALFWLIVKILLQMWKPITNGGQVLLSQLLEFSFEMALF